MQLITSAKPFFRSLVRTGAFNSIKHTDANKLFIVVRIITADGNGLYEL